MTRDELRARKIDKLKDMIAANTGVPKSILEDSTEFAYKPINPFQDDLSKENRLMIDAMRNTAYCCGYRGEDIEYAVHKALARIGRTDLLPPCEMKCARKLGKENET